MIGHVHNITVKSRIHWVRPWSS